MCIRILVIASFTKRAQLPFSAWLPAAMAAPTPVSSLVHSSTLVTAGVYLLIRHSPMEAFYIRGVAVTGGLTMLLARLSALRELDIKKLVALSTLSQLGVMIVALGAGEPRLRFLHLLAHALFKALLFIVVGDIIHINRGYQTSLKGNYLRECSPVLQRGVKVRSLRLMGIPFMSAAYSKEVIVELYFYSYGSILLWGVLSLGIVLTATYRGLLMIKGLSRWPSARPVGVSQDCLIRGPVLILFIPAIVGGRVLSKYVLFYSYFPRFRWVKWIGLVILFRGVRWRLLQKTIILDRREFLLYRMWGLTEGWHKLVSMWASQVSADLRGAEKWRYLGNTVFPVSGIMSSVLLRGGRWVRVLKILLLPLIMWVAWV